MAERRRNDEVVAETPKPCIRSTNRVRGSRGRMSQVTSRRRDRSDDRAYAVVGKSHAAQTTVGSKPRDFPNSFTHEPTSRRATSARQKASTASLTTLAASSPPRPTSTAPTATPMTRSAETPASSTPTVTHASRSSMISDVSHHAVIATPVAPSTAATAPSTTPSETPSASSIPRAPTSSRTTRSIASPG